MYLSRRDIPSKYQHSSRSIPLYIYKHHTKILVQYDEKRYLENLMNNMMEYNRITLNTLNMQILANLKY